MEKAFEQSSICITLRKFLDYRWTLEQLDQPSPGWDMCERDWRKHKLNLKHSHRMHRNLLRNEADTDIL